MTIKFFEDYAGWKARQELDMSDANERAYVDEGLAEYVGAAPKAGVSTSVSGGQCKGTTKSGARCRRKATAGDYCTTHA